MSRVDSATLLCGAIESWPDDALALLAALVAMGPPSYVLESCRLWTDAGAQPRGEPDPRTDTPAMLRANTDLLRAYRTIAEVRRLPFERPGSVHDSVGKVR